MTRRQHRRIFWLFVSILAILHVDFFNHGESMWLIFGWLPVDLVYHLVWVILAAASVVYLTKYVWQDYDG